MQVDIKHFGWELTSGSVNELQCIHKVYLTVILVYSFARSIAIFGKTFDFFFTPLGF
jgi:hypothetical protein